jgi:hypothetical protein
MRGSEPIGAATPIEAAPSAGRRPSWETALYGMLHPVRIAIVEALLWTGEPLSVTLLLDLFDREVRLNNLAYHVRVLAQAGVLCEVDRVPRRGALEHFYVLANA